MTQPFDGKDRRVTTQDRRVDKRWVIDKHVPIAMIFSFVASVMVQTGALVWFARGYVSEIEAHTKEITEAKVRITAVERQGTTIAVTESRMINVENQLRDLNVKLDRVLEGQGRR